MWKQKPREREVTSFCLLDFPIYMITETPFNSSTPSSDVASPMHAICEAGPGASRTRTSNRKRSDIGGDDMELGETGDEKAGLGVVFSCLR